MIFHTRFCDNPFWLLLFKLISCYAAGRAEYKCGSVDLKRAILDRPLVVLNESAAISNQVGKLGCLSLK